MTIWNKVKDGLDKASRVAQDAVDEGKTRLDARKARQAADQAAQTLGYAVFRAWQAGQPFEEATRDQLCRTLADREGEARRLEEAAEQSADWRKENAARGGAAPGAATSEPTEPPTAGA